MTQTEQTTPVTEEQLAEWAGLAELQAEHRACHMCGTGIGICREFCEQEHSVWTPGPLLAAVPRLVGEVRRLRANETYLRALQAEHECIRGTNSDYTESDMRAVARSLRYRGMDQFADWMDELAKCFGVVEASCPFAGLAQEGDDSGK